MMVSKAVVREILKRLDEAELATEPLMESFQKIREENLHIGEFIDAALDTRKENPPPTLEDQLAVLFNDFVALGEMFRKQEEIDKLEEQFGN